jgi:hypothetical protein
MSLRKRPTLTPALLAANRANAKKSTGPRTVRGKNRIVLNGLKHGRYARNFYQNLLRARTKEDAELFQWILDQVRVAYRLRGWRMDRQAEQLAQQAWCALGQQERRMHETALRLGRGRVRFPRRCASLWALPWTPPRLGGLGANPEYAVKSVDRFLTCLSRIQVQINDNRTAHSILKLWVRRSPLFRPLPPWVEAACGLTPVLAAAAGCRGG